MDYSGTLLSCALYMLVEFEFAIYDSCQTLFALHLSQSSVIEIDANVSRFSSLPSIY